MGATHRSLALPWDRHCLPNPLQIIPSTASSSPRRRGGGRQGAGRRAGGGEGASGAWFGGRGGARGLGGTGSARLQLRTPRARAAAAAAAPALRSADPLVRVPRTSLLPLSPPRWEPVRCLCSALCCCRCWPVSPPRTRGTELGFEKGGSPGGWKGPGEVGWAIGAAKRLAGSPGARGWRRPRARCSGARGRVCC